jgi:beta-lactamase regulating signal transducer with metallopeptidase domain
MDFPPLDWLLSASLRASLLTPVVLLAQSLLRTRLSPSWRHALWLPVLVVLLTPTFPESRWSVGSLLQPSRAPLAAPAAAAPRAVEPSSPVPLRVPPESHGPGPFPWGKLAGFTWLLGAAGLGGIGLARFLQTLRQFRRSRGPLSGALREAVTAVAREVGLSKVPSVWMGSAIQSPAVTGLFRPVLLLPADFEHTLSPEETRLVLRHELTHIQRGDLPLNALLCLLLVLHWFNPVLWIAFFKSRQDREAACDARVLEREAIPQRVAYGHTLLKVETAFHHPGLGLGFVGIFQNSAALRSRIESLLNQPNPHPLMKTTLSIGLAVLTFVGVTRAATPDSAPPQPAPKPAQAAAPQTSQPGSIQVKINRLILPRVQFRQATIEDALEFLRQKSVQLDTATEDPTKKGVNIVLAASEKFAETKITLDLSNIPLSEALKYVAQLANLQVLVEREAVALVEPNAAVRLADGADWLRTAAVRLPKVQFRNATLDEAVEFIRVTTRDLDPQKKGMNIVIKPGGDPNSRITLDLRNVPSSEALRYCAQLASYTLSFDGAVAVLTPFTAATTKSTRTTDAGLVLLAKQYAFSENTHRMFIAESAEKNLKGAFMEKGVPFPEGAAINWTARSGGRLIVRNTAENLELVDSLLEDALAGAGR